MKKTIFLLAAATFTWAGMSHVTAQGILGKLKEKAAQATGGASGGAVSKGGEKIALEDSADAFLDGKPFEKDAKGISGIYYSRSVVVGMNDDMTANKYIKKFLVTYDDATALLTLNTRYAYESSNRSKFIKPATFGYRDGVKSREYAIIKGIGKMYYEEGSMDNQYLMHTTYNSTEDLQGKVIRNEEGYAEKWSSVSIMEYAPGILLVYDNEYSGSSVRENPKEREKRKFKKATVLYKKEAAAEAAKITDQMVDNAFFDFSVKYAKGEEEYAKRTNTLKPELASFKDKPTKAALEESVRNYMTRDKWEEKLITAYPVSAWKNVNELLGLTALNTLTHRIMYCVVVVKKPNGDCEFYDWVIKQENAFATGSLAEKFAGKPLLFNGLTPWGGIDCAKVKK
ncbi:MAG: hypothetical protein EAY75_10310 [Bacteroidetes bacterium]|nr:MAG: hypothetical protein EAY75_10310 [Bacteroidota bacterium]